MQQIIEVSAFDSPGPNSTFSFDVLYSTANPVDETLSGLGLRLHFDSSVLSFDVDNGLSNILSTSFLGLRQVLPDTNDVDNDSATDSFILLSWADFVPPSDWPGEGTTPAVLYTVEFATSENFAGTTLNFTASSTAAGFELSADPVVIQGVNLPPTANNDSVATEEDRNIIINVLANDSDSGGNDTIDLSSVTATQPSNGTVTVDSTTGEITYSPNDNFSGEDSFTYTVADNEGEISAPATVTVTVNPVNDLPVAADIDNVTITEDSNVTIDVVSFASDVEDSELTATIATDPENGEASINDSGEIIYTPNEDFSGSDSFTYTVTDTEGGISAPATITVEVTPVNDVPVATDDRVGTPENTAVTIPILDNDTDIDSDLDPASVNVIGEGPSNGTFTIDTADGSITYTPNQNFSGSDSFTYTVEDEQGAVSNVATVTINVDSVNDAPIAIDDAIATDEDTSIAINSIISNDTDVDSELNPDSIVIESNPNNGAIARENGSLIYTPAEDFVGSDSFTYTVADVEGLGSNIATVNITVNPVNDAPVAVDDEVTTDEDTSIAINNIISNDTDVDSELNPDSIVIESNPNNGAIARENGSLIYTPAEGFFGSDSFTYTVEDVEGSISNPATVNLVIIPDNVAPVAVNDDNITTTEDTEITIPVLANDTDVQGNDTIDPTTVTLVTAPNNGTANIDPNTGEISYEPNLNFFGSDSFSYTVQDNQQAISNVATVTLEVTVVNDAPVIEPSSFLLFDPTPGTVLGTVEATDVDTATLAYSLIGGNPDIDGDGTAAFAIDSANGTITVGDEDEFADLSVNNFNLTVAVTDGELTTEADIEIEFPDILVFINTGEDFFEPPALVNNQIIFSGAGVDLIDNVISNSPASDRLYAGSENDELLAGTNDRLFGKLGNDILDASAGGGGNRLYGNSGNDELIAGTGDRLFGGLDDDILDASVGGGNNILYGDEGGDRFFLGANDILVGGLGGDGFFVGTGGGNTIQGNEGADRFWIADAELPASANTIEDFNREEGDLIGIGGDFGDELNEFADLSLTVESGNTTIAALGQEIAIFVGVDNLTADDFLFA